MGFYINPKDESKEQWLGRHGVLINTVEPADFKREIDGKPHTLVCLVDNGPFTAAAICVNEREYKAFTLPEDHRFKLFMFVADEDLKQFL